MRPRSGLALRHGITVLNTPGTIDSDYRGEVQVLLINLGDKPFAVARGERIAQLVVQRVERAESREAVKITDTRRGAGGFGSTGTAAVRSANAARENQRRADADCSRTVEDYGPLILTLIVTRRTRTSGVIGLPYVERAFAASSSKRGQETLLARTCCTELFAEREESCALRQLHLLRRQPLRHSASPAAPLLQMPIARSRARTCTRISPFISFTEPAPTVRCR